MYFTAIIKKFKKAIFDGIVLQASEETRQIGENIINQIKFRDENYESLLA